MNPKKLNRDDIFQYAKYTYGTEPEYLWRKFPRYAVLRNPNSGKWYGAVMEVPTRVSSRLPHEQKELAHHFVGWFGARG